MPKVITSKDLIKILKEYWYIEHHWKWSHCMLKNIKTWKYVVVPCHNKDLWVWLTLKILDQAWINRDILR